ncbi:hypothetical protein BH20ACT1_BH20ACT1_14450 [soil metagenome]
MSHVDLTSASASVSAPPPPVDLLGRFPARLTLGAVAGGVILDIGVRGGAANAVFVAGLMVVVALLLLSHRLERGQTRCLAAVAVVPVLFLTIRASPWLAVANLWAFAVLVSAAVLHARSGSLLDTTLRRLLRRWGGAWRRALRLPAVAVRLVGRRHHGPAAAQVLRVGRAALVAFPLLAVIVALLASGDAVFAGLLLPDVAPAPVVGHVVLIALFSIGVLFTVAAAGADTDDEVGAGPFGAVEVATMLILAAGVLGLFVVSQLVALTATGERLLSSSGLTPAEYARSGFFQLCWATGVLVAFLGLVRALAAPGVMAQRGVRLAAAGVPLLALGLVAVCLRRMALYDDAFGLTMLRLSVVAVALWLGVLLVLIAVRNLTSEGGSSWVLGASTAAALALILTADTLNPEAFVVRHNLDRATEGAELDIAYLAQLSDDAMPAIVGALGDPLQAPIHQPLRPALRCEQDATGVARLNLAVARAVHERDRSCDP